MPDTDAASGMVAVARTKYVAVHILDGELGDGAQLTGDPAGEDLAALFLAETAAREVASADEGDDVDDDLVLVEDGVDDDGDERGEVGFAGYLDQDDDQAACLEDRAVAG